MGSWDLLLGGVGRGKGLLVGPSRGLVGLAAPF